LNRALTDQKTGLTAPGHLPDPFQFKDGSRVCDTADWTRRRKEILDAIVGIEYGGLPPLPAETHWEELHTTTAKRLGGARFMSCRVMTGPDRPFAFLLYLLIPPGTGPFPVVLNGDACWRYATDAIAGEVLGRGAILAQFNRVEIVPDVKGSGRVSGLYRVYPEAGFGALAAWAWGYHRCVDALVTMSFVDASRIAVVGHSRGGKTSLLAGATDERIALTCANDSGAGGAGCYRWQGPKSETLADLIRSFPYWFSPQLKAFVNRETDLPFDQHDLKALVAPRPLLTTEALGDLWANPDGTWQTHLAAREVYRFLGAGERLGIWFREGGHEHGEADWRAFLDFMDWQLCGKNPACRFDSNPHPGLPSAFSWTAPARS
jgi:dienelactone hydrolase